MLDNRQYGVECLVNDLHDDNFLQKKLGFPEGISLDLTKLSVNGHSYGGVTSIVSAARDSRIKATLSTDPWLFSISRDDLSKYSKTAAV